MEQGTTQLAPLAAEAALIVNDTPTEIVPVEGTDSTAHDEVTIVPEDFVLQVFMGDRLPQISRPFGYSAGTVGYYF
ncbi:MAG TPA: hypothetical protein VHT70_05335 [Candidatus Saccharimonadales bacterium]|jgi:hypothetical protein|nr:hypothetical protein [Candidatus Saccharimonadales bacterium]